MVHYSKKDSWLIGFILAGSMIPLALGLFFLLAGGPNRNAGYLLLVIGVVVILILTYPLYYEVTTSELIVRCGVLMNRHIPLDAIDEVQPEFFIILALLLPWVPIINCVDTIPSLPPFKLISIVFLVAHLLLIKPIYNFYQGVLIVTHVARWRALVSILTPITIFTFLVIYMFA